MDIQAVLQGLDTLYERRESDRVEDYLSKNLEKALKEGDTGSAISLVNELIGFYRETSQYQKAEKYCEKLLPFMEKAGLKDTIHYGTSCLNIANAYRASGRLEESFSTYQKVIAIYEQCLEKDDLQYAGLYNNLALLYQEMEKYEEACEILNKALDIVEKYPDEKLKQAITYANLAESYLKLKDMDKAKDSSVKSIEHFKDGLTNDYHYSAALAVAGDICFMNKECEQAIEQYEQAMLLLKKHIGITNSYFRIISKLQAAYEAMGKPDALSGITMARDYYNLYGKEALIKENEREKDSEYIKVLSEIAFAKIGEGSECLGYDDIISKDHDFGPGFCIFVTEEQYHDFGRALERAYDALPEDFRGFTKPDRIIGAPRNGVIVIEDFFARILSLDNVACEYLVKNYTLPVEVWLRLEDWQLRTVTNGEVFEGKDSVYGRIYENLKKGYPEVVRNRKIAQLLGNICQEGQYNYQRMMQRRDVEGATFVLHCFEEHVMELLFLLNKEFAPHKKWIMRAAKDLKKGKNVLAEVEKLMAMQPDIAYYKDKEMIDWIGRVNYNDPVYVAIDHIAQEIVNFLQEENLTESDDTYLENHIPYVLKKV